MPSVVNKMVQDHAPAILITTEIHTKPVDQNVFLTLIVLQIAHVIETNV